MELMRRIGPKTGVLLLALAVAALGACSSGQDKLTNIDAVTEVIQTTGLERRGPPKPLNITRKLLDNTKEGVLKATPEVSGQSALLRRIVQRNDGYPGNLEVWRSTDAIELVIRSGVLVGTRGIGADVVSADASQSIARLAGLQTGATQRTLGWVRGDNREVMVSLACVMNDLGTEGVTLVDTPVSLRHFQETCDADGERITYDYWVDPSTRLIRKSRQWVGPVNKYFELVLLKN